MSEITKKALATSLKKLLSKKELAKITISNITDDFTDGTPALAYYVPVTTYSIKEIS